MMKWVIILAVIVLAPTFVTNVFSSGVSFVSAQGKALFSEVAKEATNTMKDSK